MKCDTKSFYISGESFLSEKLFLPNESQAVEPRN